MSTSPWNGQNQCHDSDTTGKSILETHYESPLCTGFLEYHHRRTLQSHLHVQCTLGGHMAHSKYAAQIHPCQRPVKCDAPCVPLRRHQWLFHEGCGHCWTTAWTSKETSDQGWAHLTNYLKTSFCPLALVWLLLLITEDCTNKFLLWLFHNNAADIFAFHHSSALNEGQQIPFLRRLALPMLTLRLSASMRRNTVI